jgi:hypothetical protein
MQENTVVESSISDNPDEAIREFISIVREKLMELRFQAT